MVEYLTDGYVKIKDNKPGDQASEQDVLESELVGAVEKKKDEKLEEVSTKDEVSEVKVDEEVKEPSKR